MPTLSELTAAYRYDFSEVFVTGQMVWWKPLYKLIERACARQRRKARLLLLLCRHRYYAEAETDDEGGAGERAPADVIVALARPGLEGAFRHMVMFL